VRITRLVGTVVLPGFVSTVFFFTSRGFFDSPGHWGLSVAVPGPLVFVNVTWLAALAGTGTLAAYWSRLAGGGPWARAVSATLPSLWQISNLILALVILPWQPGVSLPRTLTGLLRAAVPGAALLLGALPFLWAHPRRTA
jgi:hypothetical protein